MILSITFSHAASAKFSEATAWYETKRSGLALEFIDEIERCVSLASKALQQFPVVYQNIQRVVANRFPYSVYSRTEELRIVV